MTMHRLMAETLNTVIEEIKEIQRKAREEGCEEISEGLENPILRAAKSASNIAELLNAVKTKRYTLARLKRILFNALLGITREQQELAAYSDDALYIRVLGIRQSKLHLLSELQENAGSTDRSAPFRCGIASVQRKANA